MSEGVNAVHLIGHLGKDPEVRFLQTGNAVCTLRLAVGERRKEGDNWKDHVEWVDVVVWGKTAERCGEFLKKGRQVFVDGRLQTRQFKDKDGNERWKTEVVARDIRFLGSGEAKATKTSGQTQPTSGGGFDEDLPF